MNLSPLSLLDLSATGRCRSAARVDCWLETKCMSLDERTVRRGRESGGKKKIESLWWVLSKVRGQTEHTDTHSQTQPAHAMARQLKVSVFWTVFRVVQGKLLLLLSQNAIIHHWCGEWQQFPNEGHVQKQPNREKQAQFRMNRGSVTSPSARYLPTS